MEEGMKNVRKEQGEGICNNEVMREGKGENI